jgi:hypothetical protein
MYNVPCANTIYLNRYLKTLDYEVIYEEAVEKKMKEARVCVTRLVYFETMLYGAVLVSAKSTSSPIVYPEDNASIILADSVENEFSLIREALAAGETMLRAWAEGQVNDTVKDDTSE